MYALINPCNLICNMQLNVLNDLAEAMKALDGKKNLLQDYVRNVSQAQLMLEQTSASLQRTEVLTGSSANMTYEHCALLVNASTAFVSGLKPERIRWNVQ